MSAEKMHSSARDERRRVADLDASTDILWLHRIGQEILYPSKSVRHTLAYVDIGDRFEASRSAKESNFVRRSGVGVKGQRDLPVGGQETSLWADSSSPCPRTVDLPGVLSSREPPRVRRWPRRAVVRCPR